MVISSSISKQPVKVKSVSMAKVRLTNDFIGGGGMFKVCVEGIGRVQIVGLFEPRLVAVQFWCQVHS